MATLQTVSQVARNTAARITGGVEAWTGFLDTAARLYRYPFPDQLLIHAQRPDASACASFDVWNSHIRRYIRKGSRGIALIDDSGNAPKLRYVFDVADTVEYARLHPRPMSFYLWELEEKHTSTVAATLADAYDLPEQPLPELLRCLAEKQVFEHYGEGVDESLFKQSGVQLNGLSPVQIASSSKELMTASLTYILFKRCGLDTAAIDSDGFAGVQHINTLESLTLLGTATAMLAEPVLMEIGRTVKDYNRGLLAEKEGSKTHEHHLPTERGLSDPQPGAGAVAGGNRQVRPDVQGAPEGTQHGGIQRPSVVGQLAKPPARSRSSGTATNQLDGGRADAQRPAAGQGQQPAGVGTPHERLATPSGGIDSPRPHVQQVTLFPSEAEQMQLIAGTAFAAPAISPTPEQEAPALSISQDEIDAALLRGHGGGDYRPRVYDYMREHGRARGAAAFLQAEVGPRFYPKQFADSYGGVEFFSNGLTVYKGNMDNPAAKAELSWPKVQRRIVQLIEAGQFLTPAEQARYDEREGARDAIPVGRLDFWDGNGDVGESLTFTDADKFIAKIREEDDSGAPFSIVIFRDENDSRVSTDSFIEDINPTRSLTYEPVPERERVPVMEPEAERQEQFQERLTPAEASTDPAPQQAAPDVPAPQSPANFRITDDELGVGGAKTKYRNNVIAIRTLKAIEAEGRQATPEEQDLLSRYVGWGSLSQAFEEGHRDWQKEYPELLDLLTQDEYRAARASTLNAHYTSPVVIRAIYSALDGMGFERGNILEPACGTGNFFGLLPDSMADSKLYGVELDAITARIAKQLYPNANITAAGFEKTNFSNDSFDVVIGNVPFGGFKVVDPEYDRLNFNIHDYFLAKSLDKVRPGGVVAVITSAWTMDKQNPEVRRYLAQRGELVGAIRLPYTAFKANAGTEVTTDILFFKKYDRPMDIERDWVHLGQTEDGIPVNSYFADNPHMVLGRMEHRANMYGNENDTACMPVEGADLAEQLQQAVSHINAEIDEVSLDDLPEMEQNRDCIPADPDVKNHSFTIVNGEVYYRDNAIMHRRDTSDRIRGMVGLRDCVQSLIQQQLDNCSDEVLRSEQSQLHQLYDDFTREHGLINSRGNNKAFSDDSSYYLLCSLEHLDENGNLDRKADIFSKRTIGHREPITSVDTAAEALAVSIGERACVDLGFMHTLSGIPHGQLVRDLQGVIYRLPTADANTIAPQNAHWVTADEYLSGDVRHRLAATQQYAERYPGVFDGNVEALTAAQPVDLEASEISVRLGAEWIGIDTIRQFANELLDPDGHDRLNLTYSNHTGEWNIEGTRISRAGNVLASVTYGTNRASAYRLLEDALNQRQTRIYDIVKSGETERRVINRKETLLAQQKQDAIKEAFKNWIFADPERRERLVQEYNVLFNSVRPREYNGDHITFSGMNPDITLRPHQRDAIAHQLYGDNVLLAHEVGAGKSFEMIAAAMESKRLGLCSKSMMVVPNHLTEQMAAEFLRLYPSANVLVARKKDFEPARRKKFCARIATGNYDAVIIGHSQFEKIPISKERQKDLLEAEIDDISEAVREAKASKGERMTIKSMEKMKASLTARLERLTLDKRKDSVITFEELGVDKLFVDEAHHYKNLFLFTKMQNVAGLSTSDAQKSSDLFLKCQYLAEPDPKKPVGQPRGSVVFATGTPVSNSMTEIYTMMKYLQYDSLMERGFKFFDAWAAQFGEVTTAIELAPEGTGFRARTRFARFFNLPELMALFKEVADIKTADMLDLPTPKATYQTIMVQPSAYQEALVAELSARASRIHSGAVKPTVDNMLKITSDGRKIGLDQRLIDPLLPDDPGSKVNACVGNVHRIWQETKTRRSAQILFCDMSTPHFDGRFNVYEDIKQKLIARGVPEKEIAFIHDAKTDLQKKALFAKVRKGQVRVILGSTPMMGSGTNIQDKLVALHDLDAPWRPSDLAQRAGRIVRQGNENGEVFIYRYVTEKTFDSYLYQTLETKQKYIAQIMTSKAPARVCEDADATALSFAEIKALCAGNPLIMEKFELEQEVQRLRLLQSNHNGQHYRLQDNLRRHYPERIRGAEGRITRLTADVQTVAANTHPNNKGFSPMVIGNTRYTEREKAGEALLAVCRQSPSPAHGARVGLPVEIGQYRGMSMSLAFGVGTQKHTLVLRGEMRHEVELGSDVFGNVTRINHALDRIPEWIADERATIAQTQSQAESAQAELERPFPQERELADKAARLAEVDAALDLDKTDHEAETLEERSAEEGQAQGVAQEAEVRVAAKSAGAAVVKQQPSILGHIQRHAANLGADNPKGKATEVSM